MNKAGVSTMKDVTSLIDVEVENLMKSAKASDRQDYEDVIRKRQLSRTLAFDARNEVSADARYISGRIVKHLWVIFVLLPVVAGLLFVALSNMK